MVEVTNDAPSENESSGLEGFNEVPPGVNPAYGKDKSKKPDSETKKPDTPPAEKKSESAESEAEKKAAAALKKLKVKGREIEVDDAKYHEFAQKGAAATETWQEAARMKKEADDFMQRLKANPREVLTDPNLGVDFRKIAEEFIWEKIQEERMSPEEKAYRAEQQELQELRKLRDEKQAEIQTQEESKVHTELMAEYDQKFGEALSKAALPKNTGTVRRMTDYMLNDVKNGINRDPSEYIGLVEQDYMQDIEELFGGLDGDRLVKFLGEKNLKKIRTADLAKLKTTTPQSGHTFIPGKGMQPVKNDRKLSGSDWERQIRREILGR